MRIATIFLGLGLMLGPASYAVADGDFVCDGHIIESGMSLSQVQEYCGPPTSQTADRWIYDRGPDLLIEVIHVEADNTVGDIEEQPHG